ncbi:MAG: hypothetical protein ACRDTG_20950 [Pseudonocardiaceae bacterium]
MLVEQLAGGVEWLSEEEPIEPRAVDEKLVRLLMGAVTLLKQASVGEKWDWRRCEDGWSEIALLDRLLTIGPGSRSHSFQETAVRVSTDTTSEGVPTRVDVEAQGARTNASVPHCALAPGEVLPGQPAPRPEFRIEPAADPGALAAYHALRTKVFVHRQGLFTGHRPRRS